MLDITQHVVPTNIVLHALCTLHAPDEVQSGRNCGHALVEFVPVLSDWSM